MISDNSRTDSLGFHEAQLYHCGYLVPTQARLASTALWLHSFNYFLIWVQSSVIFCLYRCKSQKQTTLLLNTGPFLPSFFVSVSSANSKNRFKTSCRCLNSNPELWIRKWLCDNHCPNIFLCYCRSSGLFKLHLYRNVYFSSLPNPPNM